MKVKLILVFLFSFLVNTVSAQTIAEKWPAIAEVHSVLLQSLRHAEEGKYESLKSSSVEVYNKAAVLLKLNIPAEFRTSTVLTAIERLQSKSKLLQQQVALKVEPAELMQSLIELHGHFHEIVGFFPDEKK